MLHVTDLYKSYDRRAVVRGISLNVPTSSRAAVLGASGSGKSTLLRLLAGLEVADRGRITLNDRTLCDTGTHLPPEARAIGLMFQDLALFPHLNVHDNIRFGLRHAPEAAARVTHWLDIMRLGDHARYFPHQISGGQQQRLALARTLAPGPQLVLLDEPFSSLDGALRDDILDLTCHHLEAAQTTALLVTHDPQEAMRFADHLHLMQDGAVVQSGPAHDLYRSPVSLAAARLLGPVNSLHGVVGTGVLHTPVGRFATGLAEGTPAALLVRPEGVVLSPDATGPGRVLEMRAIGPDLLARIAVGDVIWTVRHTGPALPAGTHVAVSVQTATVVAA